MYSCEDRMRAVELYIKYGCHSAAVIRELGYPNHHTLLYWYDEYQKNRNAYAGWRERADRPAWCTQTGQMVHGGRSRGAHDRHAGLLYSVIPLRLRMESPSTRIE